MECMENGNVAPVPLYMVSELPLRSQHHHRSTDQEVTIFGQQNK